MNAKIFKCFIASPGDTKEERDICDKIFSEVNKTLGQQLNFRVESKRWENDARPGFGDDGQSVINEQLLDQYDLFIGLMWNRFGAPTQRAESGTEEEFLHAYTKYKSGSDVEIMMYFNSAACSADSLDIDQLVKVRDFKSKVSDLGGLYSVYNGSHDFEAKLRRHINDYFVQKMSKGQKSGAGESDQTECFSDGQLFESVLSKLEERLDDSLRLFSNQPKIWVDPILSETDEIHENAEDDYSKRVEISSIIDSPQSTVIKAPPQFGLTSLANHLVLEAWRRGSAWVFLDSKTARRDAIKKSVEKEFKLLGLGGRKPDCIVLDSWDSSEQGAKKLLRTLCHEFQETPVIVMQTKDVHSFLDDDTQGAANRSFRNLCLLALPRNEIRKMVCNYNDKRNIGDENVILEKVIKDLDVLNIHRTASNCITLLKVSENNFDESPANRTKMIEMILFVLFNLDELPTYKIKPDLKDCEYVLGRFCEKLIRTRNNRFSREDFLKTIDEFCKEKLLHLEVSVVFDTLFNNNIIAKIESEFSFKASYWIYYFAARRMYSDKEFRDFVLKDQNYTSFPEIIEFYTGIDRDRGELLKLFTTDLEATRSIVQAKIGLPDDLNPLSVATWSPSQDSLSKMKDLINDDVQNSNLPEVVKDKYADQSYNPLKAYNQSIQNIMHDYSLTLLIQKIKASSRALRNSDYVDPDIKRALLKEITKSWRQISVILFALAPMLATKGQASFEGQKFVIVGDKFGDTTEEKINAIFCANSINIVSMFKNDIFAKKMGPLLFDGIKNESDDLTIHTLVLLLISEMPPEWKKQVEDYIAKLPKESYYLYDVVAALTNMYKYAFATDHELLEIKYLLKLGFAKHEFGGGKPDQSKVNKISNNVIPKRVNPEKI